VKRCGLFCVETPVMPIKTLKIHMSRCAFYPALEAFHQSVPDILQMLITFFHMKTYRYVNMLILKLEENAPSLLASMRVVEG